MRPIVYAYPWRSLGPEADIESLWRSPASQLFTAVNSGHFEHLQQAPIQTYVVVQYIKMSSLHSLDVWVCVEYILQQIINGSYKQPVTRCGQPSVLGYCLSTLSLLQLITCSGIRIVLEKLTVAQLDKKLELLWNRNFHERGHSHWTPFRVILTTLLHSNTSW